MLLAGCAAVINSAFGAYLPQLGPSPLRFCPLPVFVATVAMFPPLRRDDPVSPLNAEVVNTATNLPPAENLEPLGPPAPVPAEGVAIGGADTATQAAAGQPPVALDRTLTITPQMLVDFFKPVLNGTNAVPMMAPAGSFAPPLPTPSSSATYNSN